ncbi:hypothetical protein [Nicoliella lavandulae]|uniref:Uncharacterized protein n=1 Tax=Nicoliella lavandulae TaxID=3082954 RepID=A0ABU8SMG9_9LACO
MHDNPIMRIIFNFANIQNFILIIFLFLNIGFQARNRHADVQSDGLSNFILILALCESLNFAGTAVMRDFGFHNPQIKVFVGLAIIIISWIVAIAFTIWNFRYLKKLSKHANKIENN